MDDQVIRLVLSTIGTEGITKLRADAATTKAGLESLGQQYAAGEIDAAEMGKAAARLGREFESQAAMLRRLEDAQRDAAGGADALKASAGVVEKSIHTLGESAGKAKGSTADFGRSAVELGRFLQDFQAAGVQGIANNLEGLARALGGGPGLAGVLTLLGVAYLALKPQLVGFWDALFNGTNKVPESADKLSRLTDALKANGKELDALKEKQSLTNAELAKFNELTETQTRLESEKKAADERKKEKEAFDKLTPEQQQKEQQANAEGFKAGVAGRQGEAETDLAEGLRRANAAAQTRATRRANTLEPGSAEFKAALADAEFYRKRSGDGPEAEAANRDDARALMARIAAQGRAEDVARARTLAGLNPGAGPAIRMAVENATPEVRERRAAGMEKEGRDERREEEGRGVDAAEAEAREKRRREEEKEAAERKALGGTFDISLRPEDQGLPPVGRQPAPLPKAKPRPTTVQERVEAAQRKAREAREKKAITRLNRNNAKRLPNGGAQRAPRGFRAGVPLSQQREVERQQRAQAQAPQQARPGQPQARAQAQPQAPGVPDGAFTGVAAKGVGNTARLIGVAGQIASQAAQLAAQQDAQAQQIEKLSSFVGGPRARTASPRGR